MPNPSICNMDEAAVVRAIGLATRRVVFVAPGVSEPIAMALGQAWRTLGRSRVSVILDMDPEIYRLGYGTEAGLAELQKTAAQAGELLCHQPGIRICILVCDDRTWVFSPTPLLVEEGSKQKNHPNAICLGAAPEGLAADLGVGDAGVADRTIGLDHVPASRIAAVKADLKDNPPVKFDLARKVRVFNSQLEFVEFELHGCFISRKTAEISADLIGLASDAATRDRLRSTFKVLDKTDMVDEETGLSEQKLLDERKRISDAYLTPIKGFGVVVLRANKAEFEKELGELETLVAAFKEKLAENIGAILKTNAGKLSEALFPSVKAKFPPRWKRVLGPAPTDAQIRQHLLAEILAAFGTAEALVKDMSVSALFKGVTYETLTNPDFLKLAQTEFPQLRLMEEYDAAREAKK